jgi:hypothetical protein
MNRRGLFKLLAGATAAAAMQVSGLKITRAPKAIAFDPVAYTGQIKWLNIPATPPTYFSWREMLNNRPFPHGMGDTRKTI